MTTQEQQRREEVARRNEERQKKREAEEAERQRTAEAEREREEAESIDRMTTPELIRFCFQQSRDADTLMNALHFKEPAPPPTPHEYLSIDESLGLRDYKRYAAEAHDRHQKALGLAHGILLYRLRLKETWSANADKAVRRLWREFERRTLGAETSSYPDVIEAQKRQEIWDREQAIQLKLRDEERAAIEARRGYGYV